MTNTRPGRNRRRVCYVPTGDGHSAQNRFVLSDVTHITPRTALHIAPTSSLDHRVLAVGERRRQQRLAPLSSTMIGIAPDVGEPRSNIVASSTFHLTDKRTSRLRLPKWPSHRFYRPYRPIYKQAVGHPGVGHTPLIIGFIVLCLFNAPTNCVVEVEVSTIPTIPIPDGFTVIGQLGTNQGPTSLYDRSEEFAPCTANSSLDYRIVSDHFQEGWSSCFELVNQLLDWPRANSTCFQRGGHLARPSSASDTLVIEAMLNEHPVSRDYWIDANDMNREGEWRWTDGTDIVYVNWRPGKPINSSRHFSRDCAELHRNFEWQWNDKDCVDRNNFFICQHHLPPFDNVTYDFTSTPSDIHRPSSSLSTSSPISLSSSTTTATSSAASSYQSPTTSLYPESFKTTTTDRALLSTTKEHLLTTQPSVLTPTRENSGSKEPVTKSAKEETSHPPPPPFVILPTSPLPSRASDSLSSGQIALVLLCIVAILLLLFVIGLVALPNFRRKIRAQGSSPSSPSSSIESQGGSSLNSSSSLESNDPTSPQPWVAVLKYFPSRQNSSSSTRPIVPTVTINTSPPRLPDDVTSVVDNNPTTSSDLRSSSSFADNADFLQVNAARLAIARSNSDSNSLLNVASPYGLPEVEISPQLPDFTIRRLKPADASDGETPPRPAPRWRLWSGGSGSSGDNRGMGVSNPVFMADVERASNDNFGPRVDDGGDADDADDDGGEGVLRRESPSPTMIDVRLEMDLGEYSLNDSQQQQQHQQQRDSESRGGINLPMTSRNIFMKEVLRRGATGNTFKYDKF